MAWGNSRGETSRPIATGGNREPLGKERRETQPAVKPHPAVPEPRLTMNKKTPAKHQDQSKGKEKVQEQVEQVINKGSGDWEWQPASGKRGRTSPSPDKVLKRFRGVGVLEIKNWFKRMAEDIFGGEDRVLMA